MLLNNSLCVPLFWEQAFSSSPWQRAYYPGWLSGGRIFHPQRGKTDGDVIDFKPLTVNMWRRKAWLYQSANNITVECYSTPRYSYICHTDESTRVQLFSWHSWHFPSDFSSDLSDSAGSVSLHNIFGRRKLPWCVRLPTGALDTETFHWSCRQFWLHSIWLRHQELHWQENSWIRDASSSYKGRRIHIFENLYQ